MSYRTQGQTRAVHKDGRREKDIRRSFAVCRKIKYFVGLSPVRSAHGGFCLSRKKKRLKFAQTYAILSIPHKLNSKNYRAKCKWAFCTSFARYFSYTFNLCGNKSEVLVQVCFRFRGTLFYFGGIMRKVTVTTLLERMLDVVDGGSLTLKQEEDDDGTSVVVIKVKLDEKDT